MNLRPITEVSHQLDAMETTIESHPQCLLTASPAALSNLLARLRRLETLIQQAR
jgi:hypothetical protein